MTKFLSFSALLLLLLCAQNSAAETLPADDDDELGDMALNVDAPAPPASDGSRPPSLSDYEVLIRRNIFAREQPRSRSERRRWRDSLPNPEDFVGPPLPKDYVKPAVSSPESDIVLIGAVQRDGVGTATLEDRRAGKILLVKSGDKVAGGTVGVITVDGFDYIVGEKKLKVAFGSNLEGGTSSAKQVENGATSSTDGASATGGDMGSILEQMKRKRLKELGK